MKRCAHVIHLVNEGFLSTTKRGRTIHNRGDWELLPEVGLNHCEAITSLTASRFPTARTLHSFVSQRTDLQFFPSHANQVHLQIGFEPGYPFTEDRAPRSYAPAAS